MVFKNLSVDFGRKYSVSIGRVKMFSEVWDIIFHAVLWPSHAGQDYNTMRAAFMAKWSNVSSVVLFYGVIRLVCGGESL